MCSWEETPQLPSMSDSTQTSLDKASETPWRCHKVLKNIRWLATIWSKATSSFIKWMNLMGHALTLTKLRIYTTPHQNVFVTDVLNHRNRIPSKGTMTHAIGCAKSL